jgi:predicted ester cyclase
MSDGANESKALMRRITSEIWDEHRIELVDELIADDLVDHVELPGLEGTGRSRYRASVEMVVAAFPDFANPLDLVIGEGDMAVSYGRFTGTNTGDFMGMPPTGRRIDVPVFGILRFRDGQAVERWGFNDAMAMMQQLGLSG